MNWIEIFRTGTHTDSGGNTLSFTDADLDRMVATFDPARHEPPLVLGHPKTDGPAWGWVAALKRQGSILFAAFRDVPEVVKELVAKGRYKKRSIALYADGRLRHVGLLGAATPAVEGLADIAAFAAGEFAEFALNPEPEATPVNPEEMAKRLKLLEAENALLKEKAGGADAAKIAELEAQVKALQTQNSQTTADKEAADQAFAAYKKEVRTAEIDRELDKLVADGKLLPQDKPKALAFAAALDAHPGKGGELEFTAGAAGVACADKKPLQAHFMDFLAGLPGNGLSGEFAAGDARREQATIPYSDIMNKV